MTWEELRGTPADGHARAAAAAVEEARNHTPPHLSRSLLSGPHPLGCPPGQPTCYLDSRGRVVVVTCSEGVRLVVNGTVKLGAWVAGGFSGAIDGAPSLDDVDLDQTARDIDDAMTQWVRDNLRVLDRAQSLFEQLRDAYLDLRYDALRGVIALLWDFVECDSPLRYHPDPARFGGPDGEWKLLCLLKLMLPPTVPLLTASAELGDAVDWGLNCTVPMTCEGTLDRFVEAGTGRCIECVCPLGAYEACGEKFPSGMHLLSALLSGAFEWVSSMVQGFVPGPGGSLRYGMPELLALRVNDSYRVPPFPAFQVEGRLVSFVPLLEDFLLLGLDPATNNSIARDVFPGGAAPGAGAGPSAALACVVVRIPSITVHVFLLAAYAAAFGAAVGTTLFVAPVLVAVAGAILASLGILAAAVLAVAARMRIRRNLRTEREDRRRLARRVDAANARISALEPTGSGGRREPSTDGGGPAEREDVGAGPLAPKLAAARLQDDDDDDGGGGGVAIGASAGLRGSPWVVRRR